MPIRRHVQVSAAILRPARRERLRPRALSQFGRNIDMETAVDISEIFLITVVVYML